ncbi:VTT domain-containing protein [Sphingomonas sp.]|uniref:DedA family protein n=1 Tax=Sphingomonas sp. TaxID=28214 RepID=UPI0025D49CB2|nr:VTT domain-containing protein [Sphingomonas sp.]
MTVANQPLLLVLVIVIATFVLEDIATVTVALLASHMVIDGAIAVAALVAGTVLGDLAVYYIARRAAHVPLVARFLQGAAARPVLAWLERNALAMVVVARFTPGLRLPVFAGAGSLGVPAGGFALVILLSTLVWTPGLYWVASSLGMAGLQQLGMFGWILPIGLIAAMALTPRIVAAVIERRPVALVPA